MAYLQRDLWWSWVGRPTGTMAAMIGWGLLVLTAAADSGPAIDAPPVIDGLTVTGLGRLDPPLPAEVEQRGGPAKRQAVDRLLRDDAARVVLSQAAGDVGGNTSVRNRQPLFWKADKGYYRRARDLGQVITAPRDLTLEAIVLRTGNGSLAFLPGAAGAEVFVQLFEVTGTPSVDDNGTPPGTAATHGFSTNHRCDDFISGVTYESRAIVRGGRLPDLLADGDGRLSYLKFAFSDDAAPQLNAGRRYALLIGFVEPGPERNFTLCNRNLATSSAPPALGDAEDPYAGGWGIRREGNGQNPPLRAPGEQPPAEADLDAAIRAQCVFPGGAARYAIAPTCDGYPDVDTYRDHEFYIIESR